MLNRATILIPALILVWLAIGCGSGEKPVSRKPAAPEPAPAVEAPAPTKAPEGPKVKLITGFEGEKNWSVRLAAAVAVPGPEGLTEGKQCLKVDFEQSDKWPAVTIPLAGDSGDWSGFAELKVDIHNPGADGQWLGLAMTDAAGAPAGSKGLGGGSTTLSAGKNTFTLPLEPRRAKDGHVLDYSRMSMIQLFLDRPKEAVSIVVDNVRLEGTAAVKVEAAAGIKAFDFGPAKSLAWPGFQMVTPDTVYTAARGYGWARKVVSGASNTRKPDALAGDQVGFSMVQVREPQVNEFRIDLANGTYIAAMIVRNRVPVRSWSVRAEGATLVDEKIDVGNALDHVCRNSAIDYPPGTDVFKAFVEQDYPVRVHDVEVKDDQLTMSFDSCGVHMLALSPAKKAAEFKTWLKELRDARRKEFHARHFKEAKAPKVEGKAEIRPTDKEAGLVVYTRDYSREIYTNDVPDAEARKNKAEVTLAQGEQEPLSVAVHALEDLKDVKLSVSGISVSADIRVVRFFPKINTFKRAETRMVPMHLWPTDTVDIPKGSTRQFWITFTAPGKADTHTGSIKVAAAGKPAAELPVKVKVRGFALPSPEDVPAGFGWFFTGPAWRHENWRLGWFDGPESDRKKTQVLKWEIADMQAHGCNCIQLPGPEYVDHVDGKIQLDFTEMDRYARVMKELNFGLKHDNQFFMLRIASRLMQRAGLKEFSPAFNAAYLDGMRQVKAWSEKHGIPIMYWLVDEPREKKPNSWNRNLEKTIKYLKLAKQVEGVRTTITMMGTEQDGVDYTPMLGHMDILQTHPAAKSQGLQALALKRGKPVLKFFNAGKNINRYAPGFHTWHRRSHGLFQWHYHYWGEVANPLQAITGYNWGVSNVVFLTPDGVVPTLWHELGREGVDDYRYIALLESLIAKAGDGNAAATAASKRLEEMRAELPEVIPHELCVGVDGKAPYHEILQKLPAWREELAAMIENLK